MRHTTHIELENLYDLIAVKLMDYRDPLIVGKEGVKYDRT